MWGYDALRIVLFMLYWIVLMGFQALGDFYPVGRDNIGQSLLALLGRRPTARRSVRTAP